MNESKSISSQSDGTDTRLPYAGEFPIANRVVADGDSSYAVKYMTLTESSISAFSNYSEEAYRKWWGIQKTDRVSTSNADEPVVAASTALVHFSDIVQLIDDHQNSFQEDPLCFPFSRTLSKHLLPIVLLPFCHPVLILHLHGLSSGSLKGRYRSASPPLCLRLLGREEESGLPLLREPRGCLFPCHGAART